MTTATSITVRVPLKIRHHPGRKTVVTPVPEGTDVLATRADPSLVKVLARAFRYQKLLDEGRYASIMEMAAAEKIERGYLGSLLRMTLLAPALVEDILNGWLPGLPDLQAALAGSDMDWTKQRARFGLPERPVRPNRAGEVGLCTTVV